MSDETSEISRQLDELWGHMNLRPSASSAYDEALERMGNSGGFTNAGWFFLGYDACAKLVIELLTVIRDVEDRIDLTFDEVDQNQTLGTREEWAAIATFIKAPIEDAYLDKYAGFKVRL